MNVLCEAPVPPPSGQVIIVDMYSKEVKRQEFNDLPDDIRYKSRLTECHEKEVNVMVPVTEIRVSPIDAHGNLVSKEKAKIVMVEYLDKDGKVLQTTKMTKD
jgi:hypothetical protein